MSATHVENEYCRELVSFKRDVKIVLNGPSVEHVGEAGLRCLCGRVRCGLRRSNTEVEEARNHGGWNCGITGLWNYEIVGFWDWSRVADG